MYTTGRFDGTIVFGSTVLTSRGAHDAYITKQDSAGGWLWAVSAGGPDDDTGAGLALDAGGNLLVAGSYRSSDARFDQLLLLSAGQRDVWVGKLTAGSGAWQWVSTGGGPGDDVAASIAIGAGGEIVVAGSFSGSRALFGSAAVSAYGGSDVLVACVSASGAWQWAVGGGGASNDSAQGIAADASGSVYLTGIVSDYAPAGAAGTAQFGPFTLPDGNNSNDVLVARLLASTGTWQWVTKGGGSYHDAGSAVAVDAAGDVLLTGEAASSPRFGPLTLHTGSTSSRMLVAKLSAAGAWQWATAPSGLQYSRGTGIAADAGGNAVVAAVLGSAGAVFGSTTLQTTGNGVDVVVGKLSGVSGAWMWATRGGQPQHQDYAAGVCLDARGDVLAAGSFWGGRATFGATTLVQPLAATTSYLQPAAWHAKLSGSTGAWRWATQSAGGGGHKYVTATAADAAGNTYITGYFVGTATFGATVLTGNSTSQLFIAKQGPGGQWLWATAVGGTGSSTGHGLAMDGPDHVVVVGGFSGSVTLQAGTPLVSAGGTDVLVLRLGAHTGAVQWAQRGGGSGPDYASAVTTAAGRLSITGSCTGSASFGSHTVTSRGTTDLLVSQLDTAGNWLWAAHGGGPGSGSGLFRLTGVSTGYGIATDAAGNVLVSGNFCSQSAQFGLFMLTTRGDADALIAKLDGRTGTWLWAIGAGGPGGGLSDPGAGVPGRPGGSTGYDAAMSVAVDTHGDLYATGSFANYAAAGPSHFGPLTLSSVDGSSDLWVGKISGSGVWQWVQPLGSSEREYGASVVLDAQGAVLLAGAFGGMLTPSGLSSLSSRGGYDILLAKLDPNTGSWQWATGVGGPGDDRPAALAHHGDLRVVGTYQSSSVSFGSTTLVGGPYFVTGFVGRLAVGPLSIRGFSPAAADLHVYPNPGRGFVTIATPGFRALGSVLLYDAVGKLVRAAPASHSYTRLDVSGLRPGVYLVRCGRQSSRLLIE